MTHGVTRANLRRTGISLIEVVVSTVIVALVISTSMQTVATTVSIRTRTTELQLGPSLARGLLCELLQKPYADPNELTSTIGLDTAESSGNRWSFDDVDDYHGWSSASPVYADGSAMPIGAGWLREVTVVFTDPSNLSDTGTDMGLKRINVSVTSPGGKVTALEIFRSRQGTNERPLHADREIVSGASVLIELTSGSAAATSATLSKNHAFND